MRETQLGARVDEEEAQHKVHVLVVARENGDHGVDQHAARVGRAHRGAEGDRLDAQAGDLLLVGVVVQQLDLEVKVRKVERRGRESELVDVVLVLDDVVEALELAVEREAVGIERLLLGERQANLRQVSVGRMRQR